MANLVSNIDGILQIWDDGTVNIVGGKLQIDASDVLLNNNNADFSALSVDSLSFSDASPTLSESGDLLRVQSVDGYIDIGSNNTSFAHFYTDRPSFYFSAKVISGGNQFESSTADLALSRIGSTTARLRVTAGTTISDQDFDVTGDVTISGDLTVSGTTTTLNTQTITAEDAVILLNSGQATPSNDIGLVFQRYSTTTSSNYNPVILWEETNDKFVFGSTTEAAADNDISLNTQWMVINSSGNVGIGTTSPAAKLHLDTASSGMPKIRFTHTNAGGDNFEIGSGVDGVSNGGWSIRDIDASSNRFVINSSGNVGIGTASPGHLLEVSGTGADGTELFHITSDGNVADGGYHWMSTEIAGSQSTDANIIHFIGKELASKNGGYFGFHYAGDNSDNNFITLGGYAADQLLNIKMNGNVGIGTTTPSEKLHVEGNIAVTGTVDGRDIATDGTKLDGIEANATADQTKADIDALNIDADTLDSLNSTQFIRSDAADTATGKITFDGGIEGQAIFLSGAQNFDNLKDIGFYSLYNVNASGHTNAPFQYGAMISSNSNASGGMGMQLAHERTGQGTFIRGMNDSGDTWYDWDEIWTSGTDGAGSGLDADLLDGQQGTYYQKKTAIQDAPPSGVAGDLWYESDTGILFVYYGGAWIDSAPGIQTSDNLQVASLGVGQAASGTSGEIVCSSIGIGTNNPSYKLHIVDGNNHAYVGDTQGNSTMSLRLQDNSSYPVEVQAFSDTLRFNTSTSALAAPSTKMTILPNGHVGIGTVTPNTQFEVFDSSTWDTANFTSSVGTGAGITLHASNTGAKWSMIAQGTTGGANDNNLGFHLTANGTSSSTTGYKATLTHDGHFGLGTTSPYKKLEVTGDMQLDANNASIWLKSGTTGTSGKIKWTFNSDTTVYANVGIDYDTRASLGFHLDVGYPITLDPTSYTDFKIAGSSQGRWTTTGLGVGTVSPSRNQYGSVDPKLHVNAAGTAGAYDLVARFQAGPDSNNSGAAILINHTNDRGLLIEAGREINDIGIAHFSVLNSGADKERILTLKQGGNVGIGITNPATDLHVVGAIYATGDVTAYYSDIRLKDVEGNIESALDKVNTLDGFYYTGNDIAKSLGYEKLEREVGVSAQQIEEVLPEAVTNIPGNDEYKTVKYERIVPLLIESIKEIDKKYQDKIDMLMKEIEILKGKG